MLASHSIVSVEQPNLSDMALYREILLHAEQTDPSQVDEILQRAEDSVDKWTASGRETLGFRELVHFIVLSKYIATGHAGAILPFQNIVNSLIPANF